MMGLNLDPQALLMSTMAGGSSRSALLQQALQNTDLDPVMGQLVSQMLTRNEVEEAEEINEQIAERDQRIDDLRDTLKDLSRTLKRVHAEVEALRAERTALQEDLGAAVEQVELLAGALGVCDECLGEASDCPTCGGQGYAGSGFYRPDPILYRRFISPAVAARRPTTAIQGPAA
jgi:DNA repair exonuclease SbcCD ATPase subunit